MDDIAIEYLEQILKALNNIESSLESIDSTNDAILRQIQMKT